MSIPCVTAFASASKTSTIFAITKGSAAASEVAAGTVITLTATVKAGTPAAGVTLGQVNFCVATAASCTDIHKVGSAQLGSGGKAVFKFVPPVGVHSYKAAFTGTQSDASSSSAAEPLTVDGATKTTIAQSGSVGNYTLKATVVASGDSTAPTSDVSFRDTSDANKVLGTAALGKATEAVTWTNSQNPAVEPQPVSIAVTDFNGDGIPDLAIGTTGTKDGYVSILLGNGDGTFQAAKSFAALTDNQAIATAAFVDGGPEDILTVSSNSSGTSNVALFVGDGKGGGQLGKPFDGGIYNVNTVVTADFDRDGHQDFAVGGLAFDIPAFSVFVGKGDGTFNGGTLNATAEEGAFVLVVGDFNGQGFPDIVTVDSGGEVDLFLQDGAGDFYPTSTSTTLGSHPVAVVAGDFNGDGKLDLAVANEDGDNVTILLGKGDGTFTTQTNFPAGHTPASIAIGDFNGDGIADLAVLNSGDSTVSILLGDGKGAFKTSGSQATDANPTSIVVGNFSGNGYSDFAVTNQDIGQSKGSTLTVEAAELTQTASATVTGISPAGSGTHLVAAEYEGDSLYETSTSATTSLTGSSGVATISVGPKSLAFPSTSAGSTSAAQVVKITNTGTSALLITSISLVGSQADDFGLSNTCGSSLTAGATCMLSVTFKPVSTGTKVASITITDNGSGSPQSVALTGAGTASSAGAVTLNETSLTFPGQSAGTTSASQTVTLTNSGGGTLSLSSIALTGGQADDFGLSKTCGSSLAAGASCTLTVTFKPVSTGTKVASITITDNASGSPQSVALSGTGTAASVASATLSKTSLTFPSQAAGTTSASQSVTLTNSGSGTLTLSSISLSGGQADDYVLSKTCGSSLAAGASCTLSVKFKPVSSGTKVASIAITDNASGSPQSVALTGTGTASQ